MSPASHAGQPVDASAPTIPGYRLASRIGQGGSGTVYQAEATDGLARAFAVKVFPPRAQGAYEREVKTLRAIERVRSAAGSHDLVETVAADTVDGHGYVVMEFVPGGSLQDIVRDSGPLEARAAVELIRPVLRGLALLHREGILHKDVKPANVLVGDDGHPRLGDFGLARPLDGPVSSAGTPGFCAPELYAGRSLEAGGERLDVYSAAATLYYLLTGEAPLPGRPDLFLLERLRVDRALQGVLFEALAEDPARRTGAADALAERLTAWSEGRLTVGEPPRRWPLLVALALLVAAPLAYVLSTRADPAPILWDGRRLSCAGPAVRWSDEGSAEVQGRGTVAALGQRPVATAWSPDGRVLAAIGPWGETVAIDVSGAPRVLYRLPGAQDPDGTPPLCAVATDGRHLARAVVHTEHGAVDLLGVYDLERGERVPDTGDPASASAIALASSATGPPTLVLGTPTGALVVRGPGEERVLHTFEDEILALAVDAGGRVLVVGDDRRLLPAGDLGADGVLLPDGTQGLAPLPDLKLRVYSLDALRAGRLELLQEVPANRPVLRSALTP